MINASFSVDKESGAITMKCSGHAGAADPGEDTICAAASMLAMTLAQTIEFAYSEDKLQKKPNVQISSGRTWVTAKPTMESYGEILHAFFVIQVGFSMLSIHYPQYVKFKSFGDSQE